MSENKSRRIERQILLNPNRFAMLDRVNASCRNYGREQSAFANRPAWNKSSELR